MKTLLLLPLTAAALALSLASVSAQTTRNWTNTVPGTYEWNDAANWTNDIPDTSGESAVFNAAGSRQTNTYNITVNAPITVAQITMNNITGAANITNNISGSEITLNDSTGNPARIQRSGTTTTSPVLNLANNILLNDPDGVRLNAIVAFALNGVISGSSVLQKTGNSTVYLGGANTFSGGIHLDAGQLYATSTSAFSGTSGTITFLADATPSLGTVAAGTTVVPNPIDFSNSSADTSFRTLGSGCTLELTTSAFSNTGGAGTINLVTRVAADAFYGIPTGTGTGTVKFSGTGFTMSRPVAGASTAVNALELAPASGTQTWNGNFTNISTLTKSGLGTLVLGGTVNGAVNNTLNLNDGTVQFTTAEAASPIFAAVKTFTINLANVSTAVWDLNGVNQSVSALTGTGPNGSVTLGGATLTMTNAATGTLNNPITGPGAFVKTGSANLTVNSSLSINGPFTNQTGQTTFAGTNTFTGITVNGGTLVSSQAGVGTNTLLLNNGSAFDTGSTVTNNLILAGRVNLKGGTLTGQISGSGGIDRPLAGAGTLTLTSSNTFTGGVTDLISVIVVGNKYALGTGVLSLTNGAQLQGSVDDAMAGLNGPTNDIVLLGGTVNFVATGGGNLGLLGNISGPGGISKASANNVLALYGSNTYSGTTSGSNGRLVANGSLGTNTVTCSGMTLSGNATFGGDVIFTAGTGTLQPGDYVGSVSQVGKMTMRHLTILSNNSSKITFDFNVGGATNDRIACVDLNLNTNTPVTMNALNGKLVHGRYRLIDYTGAKTGGFGTITSSSGLGGSQTGGTKTIDESTTNQIDLVIGNVAPVAVTDNITNAANVMITIAITNLLANDTDVDGDTLYLVSTGSQIPGLSNDGTNLYLPATNANESFTYTIHDGFGGTNTGTVNITILAGITAPTVSVTPAGTNAPCGSSVTLTAVTNGAPGTTLQWYNNQTNLIANETNLTLTLNSVSPAHAGHWTVIASNSAGQATNFAVLTVVDAAAPVVTSYQTNTTLALGAQCSTNTPDLTSTVVSLDACSGSSGTTTQSPLPGVTLILGTNLVTLFTSDASGNTATNLAFVVVTGNAPVTFPDEAGGITGWPIQMLAARFLTNDTNGDGRAMSVSGVSYASTNASLTFDGTNAVFTVTNGFVGDDSFTYTNRDCAGLWSTNLVVVHVQAQGPGYNSVSASTSGGTNFVSYQGIPGRHYALERTTNLPTPPVLPDWTPLVTNVADGDGRISFSDVYAAPLINTGVFYRTRSVAP